MINSFKQYLVEEEGAVYFTFGRMNPPTIGHGKLLDKLATTSGRNPYRIYVSQSYDSRKNPLDYQSKVKHVRKMFPKHARQVMLNKKVKTAIDAATVLHAEGFTKLVMVVGDDRVREFDILLNKYNGKKSRHGFYNFSSIKVVTAGQRDPDAEGAEGASATKQRQTAKDNDFTSFSQGLPKTMSNADAKKLFNDVRKGMGLKEQKEFKNHVQLQPVSQLREAYVKDGLFEQGDQVVMLKNERVGKIKHLGANYVIVESKGETWRCWLDDVTKVDPETSIEYQEAPYKDPGDDGIIREEYKYEYGTDAATKHARKMTPGQNEDKKRPGLWANMHAKRARGEPMRKKGEKGAPTPDQIKRAQENISTRQDPDIADRKGSQPARYFTGLSKATKIARDRHFKSQKKGPAPGDATAKTKPSKNTLFVRDLMGEKVNIQRAKAIIKKQKEREKQSDVSMAVKHDKMMDRARLADTRKKNKETNPKKDVNEYGGPPISRKKYLKPDPYVGEASFADKAKKSGISVATLKKVYARGVAAHRTSGHRPGTSPEQWGHGRVNAFIRKKKQGNLDHDKDLA